MLKLHYFTTIVLLLAINWQLTAQPTPPSGKTWQTVPELTDEFNSFDSNKWQKGHPYWDGRDPSEYNNDNVSFQNGELRLKMSVRNTNMQGNWIWASCLTSKTKAFKAGMYAECRVKIANLPSSTAFWMQGDYSEIDVIENFGDVTVEKWKYLNYTTFIHTHYFKNGWDNDLETDHSERNPNNELNRDGYHTFGVWWKDNRNLVFYRDGVQIATGTTRGDFNEPMYMFFDTEAMPWIDQVPSIAQLNDNSRNTAYFSYVKTYKLADGSTPPPTNTYNVPGTVEAENFASTGGTFNDGNVPLGVNKSPSTINWVNKGDWVEYDINATQSGDYEIEYRISTPSDNAQIQIAFDGNNVSTDNVVNNGQWDAYQTLKASGKVNLSAGSHKMRITASGSNNWQWNLDKITLSKSTSSTISVTGVDVSPSTTTLTSAGATQTLTTTVSPSNATNKSVSWSSNNTSVATVNSNGVVTAKANGTATITATTVDGNKKDNCVVTVSISTNPPPSGGNTLSAIQDAYLQGTTRYNTQDLRVESGNRVSYLIFDLSNISGTVTSAKLQLSVSNDAGNGNIKVEKGNNTSWTETNLSSSNKPASSGQLGSLNTTYSIGQTYTWNLTASSISAGGKLCLIVSATSGNDVSFGSAENSSKAPKLIIETNGSTTPDPDPDPDPDPTPGALITVQAESFTSTSGTINDAAWGGPGLGANKTATTINWVNNGDYMDYSVNIPETGSYEVVYYISSPNTGSTISIGAATPALNTTTVPNNGGWDSYVALKASSTINLTAGNKTIRLTAGAQTWTWNLDKFTIQRVGATKTVAQANAAVLNKVASDIKVYPNPVRDFTNIQVANELQSNARVILYSNTGRRIMVQQLNSSTEQLDMSGMQSGMYILKIVNGQQVRSTTVVKK